MMPTSMPKIRGVRGLCIFLELFISFSGAIFGTFWLLVYFLYAVILHVFERNFLRFRSMVCLIFGAKIVVVAGHLDLVSYF